jgi:hypothetical protein
MAQFPTGTYDLSLLQSCQPIQCVLRAASPQANSACNKPTQLHLVSRLLMSRAKPPVPRMPSWNVVQGQLYFY